MAQDKSPHRHIGVDSHDTRLTEHEAFKTLALSRLAAQHDEIHRLRDTTHAAPAGIRALPTLRSAGQIGPC